MRLLRQGWKVGLFAATAVAVACSSADGAAATQGGAGQAPMREAGSTTGSGGPVCGQGEDGRPGTNGSHGRPGRPGTVNGRPVARGAHGDECAAVLREARRRAAQRRSQEARTRQRFEVMRHHARERARIQQGR